MCGRLNLRTGNKQLAEAAGALLDPMYIDQKPIRFDVTPQQRIPVIRTTRDGERELVEMKWGLILPFAKTSKDFPQPSNSRDDKLGSPMYSKLFRESRCAIPLDDFYEWPVNREGGAQIRTLLRRRDGQTFWVGGIWSRFTKEETPIESTSMITTVPNDYTKQIHDRTIVILEDEQAFNDWLNPEITDPKRLMEMVRPCSDDLLEAYPVVWASELPEELIEPTGAAFEMDDPRLQNQLFVTEEMKVAIKKKRAAASRAAKKPAPKKAAKKKSDDSLF